MSVRDGTESALIAVLEAWSSSVADADGGLGKECGTRLSITRLAEEAGVSRSNIYNYPKVLERLKEIKRRSRKRSVRDRQIASLRKENAELKRRITRLQSLLAAAYLKIENVESQKVVKLRSDK